MPGQRLFHVEVQRGKAPGEQVLLGTEMRVKGPGSDAGALADVPDGDLVKTVFPGKSQGGLQDGLLRLAGLLFPPLTIVHVSFLPSP